MMDANIGIISNPTCSSVNVMIILTSFLRRRRRCDHCHYTLYMPNDVTIKGILQFIQKPLDMHFFSDETIFTTPFKTTFLVQLMFRMPINNSDFKSMQTYCNRVGLLLNTDFFLKTCWH